MRAIQCPPEITDKIGGLTTDGGAGVWFRLSHECAEGMVGEGDITI